LAQGRQQFPKDLVIGEQGDRGQPFLPEAGQFVRLERGYGRQALVLRVQGRVGQDLKAEDANAGEKGDEHREDDQDMANPQACQQAIRQVAKGRNPPWGPPVTLPEGRISGGRGCVGRRHGLRAKKSGK